MLADLARGAILARSPLPTVFSFPRFLHLNPAVLDLSFIKDFFFHLLVPKFFLSFCYLVSFYFYN